MKTFIITALVVGERVTLFHQQATQRTVSEWMENNEQRLIEKGFNGLEIRIR